MLCLFKSSQFSQLQWSDADSPWARILPLDLICTSLQMNAGYVQEPFSFLLMQSYRTWKNELVFTLHQENRPISAAQGFKIEDLQQKCKSPQALRFESS